MPTQTLNHVWSIETDRYIIFFDNYYIILWKKNYVSLFNDTMQFLCCIYNLKLLYFHFTLLAVSYLKGPSYLEEVFFFFFVNRVKFKTKGLSTLLHLYCLVIRIRIVTAIFVKKVQMCCTCVLTYSAVTLFSRTTI